MKAIEFVTRLEDEKHIDIPLNFQNEIKKDSQVRVLILVDETGADDSNWRAVTQAQFLNGYSEKDSVYDNE